jgi:hypothetical protein
MAVVALGLALGAGAAAQERIEFLPGAQKQQEIEILAPAARQDVQAVAPGAEQDVRENQIPTSSQRTASAAGKVLVGVLAAVVAIGASAASLLLL